MESKCLFWNLRSLIDVYFRTFTYLAYANSELKTHSCYLVAPFKHEERDITATDIVNQLGTFNDKTVAKRASRIGPNYSNTPT